ncbi:hypothetical protein KQX54_011669 [Cotesia glomerata]|uniref:TIP41-like protein n=2 Tax=Cotesia glomerata TaxID=32391 RepID=A0AAV7IUH9_COTGL|nr:hypothetical protein KQX54_011669 [Cotesia glomerata]
MPGSLFILLRYFLRIDNVMMKVNDTRIYHEFHKKYLIREYTSREAEVEELTVPYSLFVDPSQIAPHLPLNISLYHKLTIPEADSSSQSKSSSEPEPKQSNEANHET